MREKRLFKLYLSFLLYFLSIIIIMIITHHTFLGVQDEAQLLATLKSNEPINYMTSYPLALIIGYLYQHFPTMQWYSIMMTFYIVLIAFIMAFYVTILDFKDKFLTTIAKVITIVFFTMLLIYMLVEVDVTSPTLILIALAVPFIRYNQLYFWLLVWIASFLRVQIIFSLAPLLLIAYIVMVDKSSFFKNKKTLLFSLVFIFGIVFNNFSYMLNKNYKEWMEFTEKRAYFTDFGGAPKGDILSKDEFRLARTWWIVDQDLYPYKKVMKAAGSTVDIIKQRLQNSSVTNCILFILSKHPTIYLLLIVSLIIAILYRSWFRFFGYFIFTIVVVILLIVKDVSRVTVPIYLIWIAMLAQDLWFIKEKFKKITNILLIMLMLQGGYTIYKYLPKDRLKNFQERELLAKELRDIIKRNNMELEITTGFPASWEYLIEGIMQNHLFDEKNWVDYYDDLLLQGWFSRVPLVYKQHNISFNGVKRKYEHYHDWLVSPKAGIIGSKGENRHIRIFLRQKLLKMYDKKFPKKGCHHEVIVVDESEHFIIHKVVYICNNQTENKVIWRLQDNLKNIKTQNMVFKDNKIIIKGKDPKFFITIKEKLPKYIMLDITLKTNKTDMFQVFHHFNNQASYSEAESIIKKLKKGENHIQIVIPSKYLNSTLRIDPSADKKGEIEIKKFDIYPYKLDN